MWARNRAFRCERWLRSGPAAHTLTSMPVSIVVIDDHQVFTDAIAARLSAEPDLDVVATAMSAADGRAAVKARLPDVAVVDVNLGGDDGIELADQFRELAPETRVIVISTLDDPDLATRAVLAGATGFLLKESGVDQLIAAVRGVLRRETWINPRLLTDVIIDLREPRDPTEPEVLVSMLTDREREVLVLLMDGLDRGAIAKRLYVSANTVRTHMANLFAKLGVHSGVEAVSIGARAGLART